MIEVIEFNVSADEAALVVELSYRVRGEDEVRTEQRRIPALAAAGGAP